MRLLAKNAEERYQTAAGLEADLRRCLAVRQSHDRIDFFPLGADDSSDRLLIAEKLYGREREVDALFGAFNRVVKQGATEMVLVCGYSGVGKSSVVNELHKVLVPPRALFAAGKFDQHKSDIPYSTLAQAIQMLLHQILVKSEAEVVRWRGAFLEALGPNGQLIVNLVPELEFIIGQQPDITGLPPQESQNRFKLVLRRFLGVFATAEHPLALFLDDLQWLDAATFDFIEHLITHPEVRHLLMICAYREDEVGLAHRLTRTLDALKKADAKVSELLLAPLKVDDVGHLVANALNCGIEFARPLSRLIHQRTGGNPFFAVQFLTELAAEGLLAFDPAAHGWHWDIDCIRAKGYTGNVVDLMAGKLRRLTVASQKALNQLACMGNAAETGVLVHVYGETMDAVLSEAVRAGLVVRQEREYRFLHDRIQQAAYALVPEEQSANMHLQIGRALLANLTADELEEHLFDVANQLNRGAVLLSNHDEKMQVAAIDLRAGRKAKASAAYASALTYFSEGMALLEESDWTNHYQFTFSLWLECTECELVSGNTGQAEHLIQQLIPRAGSNVDEAAVYHLKVQLHVMKSDYQQAVATALAWKLKFELLKMRMRDEISREEFERANADFASDIFDLEEQLRVLASRRDIADSLNCN